LIVHFIKGEIAFSAGAFGVELACQGLNSFFEGKEFITVNKQSKVEYTCA
jgi:hypothetical protein